MSLTINLSDRTALVTGSSQGIGAAIARALHRAGARVVVNHPGGLAGRDADSLRDELESARAGTTMVIEADVADPSAVEAMMRRVADEWSGLDILVNNAGILRDRSILKMTPEEWRSVLDVDLGGVFFGCKYGLPILRDGGAIVSIGSLAARMGFHGQSNYAAAKAGVHALTRVLARECSRRSIRVNAVAPGVIDTPIRAAMPEEARRDMLAKTAASLQVGRVGQGEDIARQILAFMANGFATGSIVYIDGGALVS